MHILWKTSKAYGVLGKILLNIIKQIKGRKLFYKSLRPLTIRGVSDKIYVIGGKANEKNRCTYSSESSYLF